MKVAASKLDKAAKSHEQVVENYLFLIYLLRNNLSQITLIFFTIVIYLINFPAKLVFQLNS